MLQINPAERISAIGALRHPWFISPDSNAGVEVKPTTFPFMDTVMTDERLVLLHKYARVYSVAQKI
jgi:hypothetical protein